MKRLVYALLLPPIISAAAASPMKTVQTCRLEDGSEATLQAQYDRERDADRFFVTMDGKTETAFTDLPDADYSGQIALSKCVHHVLIFAISYGAPYHKGVVIRRTAQNRTTQRIDFSEKALPAVLYLGKSETELLIPNIGYEVSSKYLLYRFQIATGQPEAATGIDTPPANTGFEVIRIQ